jgi:hypothetical protein
MSRLALVLAAAIAVAQEQPPPLATRTLSDREFTIPTDLPPGPAVLIVGFTRGSRTQTSAWSRQLADLKPDAVFQVAILEDVPALLRRFVISGIKSDIPQALQDRFLIVTQGTPAWEALRSSPQEDEACVLLLAGDRHIVWRGGGNVTEQSTVALRRQIAELMGQL